MQEYFDLLPERGRYHFETLDRSVEMILATGAKPLMCVCFKPRVSFPAINQDIVHLPANKYRPPSYPFVADLKFAPIAIRSARFRT